MGMYSFSDFYSHYKFAFFQVKGQIAVTISSVVIKNSSYCFITLCEWIYFPAHQRAPIVMIQHCVFLQACYKYNGDYS